MSCTGVGTTLKTEACWSYRVVSALRNHVHYIMNYVFEGRRPGDPRGNVVVRCLWVDLRQIIGELTVMTPNIHQELPLTTCH